MLKDSKRWKKGVNLELDSMVEDCGFCCWGGWVVDFVVVCRGGEGGWAFVTSWQRNNLIPPKHGHHSECNWCKSVQLAASGSARSSDFSWKAGPLLLIERSLPNLRASALVQAFITRHERSTNCSESRQACDCMFDCVGWVRSKLSGWSFK